MKGENRSRSRSNKIRHKERTIEEEEQARRRAKHNEQLKAKDAIIKIEFERHKKKIMLSSTEISKNNELRVNYLYYVILKYKLRSALNDLLSSNDKKKDLLNKLNGNADTLTKQNEANTDFVTKVSQVGNGPPNENIYLSLEYQSVRTTSGLSPVKPFRAEPISDKLGELKGALENIDRLNDIEEETEISTKQKFEEATKNNVPIYCDSNII